MQIVFGGVEPGSTRLLITLPFGPTQELVASLFGADGVTACDVIGGRMIVVWHDGRDPIKLSAQCLLAIAARYNISIAANLSVRARVTYAVDAAQCRRLADFIELTALVLPAPPVVLMDDIVVSSDLGSVSHYLRCAAA